MLAYSVLFGISAALGLFGVWLLSITPEQPMPPAGERTRILPLLAAPFGDVNFRRLIVFQSSWNFAANLAAPFFAVYMLKTLGYSMTMVIALTTASQLSNLAALGLWGNLIDRFSNKAVLEVSAPLFLACTLAWTFTGIRLGAADDALSAVGRPCADGHRHGRRGAGLRQHRNETVSGRPGDRVPRGQQRGERNVRRDRADHRRAMRRLLRGTCAYARLHLERRWQ